MGNKKKKLYFLLFDAITQMTQQRRRSGVYIDLWVR